MMIIAFKNSLLYTLCHKKIFNLYRVKNKIQNHFHSFKKHLQKLFKCYYKMSLSKRDIVLASNHLRI